MQGEARKIQRSLGRAGKRRERKSRRLNKSSEAGTTRAAANPERRRADEAARDEGASGRMHMVFTTFQPHERRH